MRFNKESEKTGNGITRNRNNDLYFEQLLKKALKPVAEPGQQVNAKLMEQVDAMDSACGGRYRIPAFMLAVFCILLLGSISFAAAVHFLSPTEIAEDLEDIRLSEALDKENDLNGYESQVVGGFKVTFLGLLSGEDISDSIMHDNSISSGTYAVIALENADGTPMTERLCDWQYSCNQMFLVEGYGLTHCIANSAKGYSRNGIIYYIFEADNVEIFADRIVYLAVYGKKLDDEMQHDEQLYTDPYLYDEDTGKVSRNEAYEGMNALFEIPLDPEKADPKAAEEYMQNH